MNKILLSFVIPVFLVFFFSCASVPPQQEPIPEPPQPVITVITPEQPQPPPVIIPVPPEKPDIPEHIMGKGRVDTEKLALFLLQNNPNLDQNFARTLAGLYIEEALFEGVDHDIAFTQMCLETGFLRFGGDVKPEQNNFAGLGAIGNGEPGLSFPDPRTGVRAQIQHLKAYGSEEPLKGELVNPRFRFVRRGSAPTIEGLAGTWAVDNQYAVKINSILQRLYDFSF